MSIPLAGLPPIQPIQGLVGLPGYPGMGQLPPYMQQMATAGAGAGGGQMQGQPGMGSPGASFGAGDQMDRNMQQYGRGQAPFTGQGLMTALGNAGIVGAFASPGMALMGAARRGIQAGIDGQPIGAAMSPLHNIPGFMGPTMAGRSIIKAGGTVDAALAADRAHHVATMQAADAATARGQRGIGQMGGGGNSGGGRIGGNPGGGQAGRAGF